MSAFKRTVPFIALSVMALLYSSTVFSAEPTTTTTTVVTKEHQEYTTTLAGMTLHDAVSKGLETNPQYARVAKNSLATRQELDQAKAGYLPSVDLRADTGYERTKNPSFGGDSESLYRNNASLTLTQMLFDGFATKYEVERQKARSASSIYRAGESAEFTALDITEAFLEVLRQRELLKIAVGNAEAHDRILGTIRTGVNAGTVTDGDLSQAEARRVQAQSTVTQTEERLHQAEASFIRTVGEKPDTLIQPNVPREELPSTIEDAVNLAKTENPTLAIYAADMNVAEAEYKSADSPLYPRFDLEAAASAGNNLSGIRGSDNGQSLLGVMRWNLYRGGADVSRQREFRYRNEESKEAYADALRQVEKDLRDTWAGRNSAAERSNLFKQQFEENQKVVGVYSDQFTLGRRTLLDLLDSQNELFVSNSNFIDSYYTEAFAAFRLFAIEGKLLNIMGLRRPAEARASVQ